MGTHSNICQVLPGRSGIEETPGPRTMRLNERARAILGGWHLNLKHLHVAAQVSKV
jgi:hypothetical protein